jgi:hypothetical protein
VHADVDLDAVSAQGVGERLAERGGVVVMTLDTMPADGPTLDVLRPYPDPAGRQRVIDAMEDVNRGYEAIAASYPNVVVVSPFRESFDPYKNVDARGNVQFNGQRLQALQTSNDPRAVRLKDGHFSTILNGIIADHMFIEPMNEAFGFDFEPFSEDEILEIALGESP